MEGTSAAVDDIVVCARRADEADLVERGYEKLQPQLKAVGLGKVLCLDIFFVFAIQRSPA